MRKIILILCLVIFFFVLEFILFNIGWQWGLPNLSLLLVVFFTLTFGIRYGILTALLAGVLQDSFSIGTFGFGTFSFVVCAYATPMLRKYINIRGSSALLLMFVVVISILNIAMRYLLCAMFNSVMLAGVFHHILIPEMFTTLIITQFTFAQLRKCVSKLFI